MDKSHSRQTGGTGLGLSIVKHGATLHHAQIQCGQRSWKRYKNGAAFLERVAKGFLQIVTYSLQKAFWNHIEAAPLDKLQFAQCILICHNNCIGMELKDGSRALWGNRSFDCSGESLGFVFAVSYKKNGLCAHNIAGSHRN